MLGRFSGSLFCGNEGDGSAWNGKPGKPKERRQILLDDGGIGSQISGRGSEPRGSVVFHRIARFYQVLALAENTKGLTASFSGKAAVSVEKRKSARRRSSFLLIPVIP